ncbi:MAG: LLM class flavin-dependent oxidoreductase [Candidatus Limnocylindria bacterium]
MEFAVQIEPQFGYAYEDIEAIALDAERLGLSALWVSDHLFLHKDSVDTNCLEAWTLLAALARATTTLRLGTLVTCQSYRNPALLAKIAAGLDHISNGRLEFGVGAGWKEIEYRAYGYEFPSAHDRVDELVDTLDIVRRMWTEDKASYEGKRYRIADAQCAPKPLQKLPRVWIGGGKPRILRVTAKYGDAINYQPEGFPTPEVFRDGMPKLDAACRAVGRNPQAILRTAFLPVIVARTQREVDAVVDESAKRAGRSRDEWLAARPAFTIGTPERVTARLREYAAAGVAYAIVLFPYQREREMLPVLAEEVMPTLR